MSTLPSEFEAIGSSNPPARRLDQTDVVLVAHSDQIQMPEHSHLEALNRFTRDQIGNLVTTVHVLPANSDSVNQQLPVLLIEAIQNGDASNLTRWAASLDTPQGECYYFNFSASAEGIRSFFDAVTDNEESLDVAVDKFLISQAIVLALAGVPKIYLPSLFGAQDGLHHFDALELDRELRDPWSRSARVFSRFSELLSVRRSQQAFHPHAPQTILNLDPSIFAVERYSTDLDERVLCLHNVTNETVKVWTGNEHYTDLVNNADRGAEIKLRPYEIAWLHQKYINLT